MDWTSRQQCYPTPEDIGLIGAIFKTGDFFVLSIYIALDVRTVRTGASK